MINRFVESSGLFQKVEDLCRSEAILASNTSSLTLKDIGARVKNKHRLVTTHWFNPPQLVPTVEIVRGEETSDDTVEAAYDLLNNVSDPFTAVASGEVRLKGRIVMIDAINQIKQHSVVLLVEQNFYMASQVGDDFYILDDGKVVHSGSMQDLVEDEELQSRYLGISK